VISKCDVLQKKFTGPKKGQFPEIDDAVLTFFFSGEAQEWNNCVVLMACTAALLFFQNPVIDRESNPHTILMCI
jgi:hypothetical protein